MSYNHPDLNLVEKNQLSRAKRMMLYLGIFSIIMLFAGLTSGYVVALYGEFWVKIVMPSSFYISTVLIVLSSLTLYLASVFAKRNNQTGLRSFLIITLLLGIGFSVFQFNGWKELTERGMYLRGFMDNIEGEYGKDFTLVFKGETLFYEDGKYYSPNDPYKEQPLNDEIAVYSNTASSFLYILTFVHVVHLLGGIIALIFTTISAFQNRITPNNTLKLRLSSTYWHFLDLLWIYLFLFLSFIH